MTLRQKLLEANEVWLGHMGHSDDQSCLAASSTELADTEDTHFLCSSTFILVQLQ